MKHFLLPLFAAAILALATFSVVRTQPAKLAAEPSSPPPRAEFTHRVAAVGIVEPVSENISLASHLPGVVEEVLVQTGDEVAKGQALVKLDTRTLKAELAERESDLALKRAAVLSALARVRKADSGYEDAKRHWQFANALKDSRSLSAEELSRRKGAMEVMEAEREAAEAEVGWARAAEGLVMVALNKVRVELERSTVTAPRAGRVLQLRIRAGEFAPAGPAADPWLVLGDVSVLHVRADVDEHEAWRVKPGARAVAQVRGNAALSFPAAFIRFEPLVVPKRSLTGSSSERVDTRVLQVIYRVDAPTSSLIVGQQMDVFIEADPIPGSANSSRAATSL
ncbi:MAG: biotin/lipoyl-binding protein [Verrucomicrobia bacterium]|nr:biotin/lipoyl-binding protein [Verrucomicrobiota bacterium]